MRLIDADALIQELLKGTIMTDDLYGMGLMAGNDHAVKKVVNAPTIEAEPVRHGVWSTGYYNYEGVYVRDCSYCGYAHDDLSPYCPSCGAKMESEV